MSRDIHSKPTRGLRDYYIAESAVCWFSALRAEGLRFESYSGHHVGTVGKSFTRSCMERLCGIQVLYRGVLIGAHPARVTHLHHCWGAPEAEIFVFKFLPWPRFEPRTAQSNGRERYHSTTAPPQ